MDTYDAAAIAGFVITCTGALAMATAAGVAAAVDWMDAAPRRKLRRESEARIIRFRARVRARLGLEPVKPAFSYQKNGGLHFVKAGRLGAAVWISRR